VLVKDIERNLTEGLQLSPNHPYLLDAEAQLADILSDSRRVLEALQRAFKANPRSTFIALRLANYYKHLDNYEQAKEILEKAIEANPSEPRLHYSYAKMLLATGNGNADVLTYHLRRSFTDGDDNYDAQLLYGRQLFINGDVDNRRVVFRRLSDAKVSPEVRSQLLHPLDSIYKGTVVRLEAIYCFISRDGINDWLYAHRSNISESDWKTLAVGTRVTFRIAFTMRGPNAFSVELAE
jgi:tetratricopeptide (TPR) repeat protein